MRNDAPIDSEENHLWRISDSFIINTKDKVWGQYFTDFDELCCLKGRLWLDKQASLAVLGAGEERSGSFFPSLRVARRNIKKLPVWQMTRWVCKVANFGQVGWVLDCLTGTQVEAGSFEFNAVIAKANDMFKGGQK
jgi:hypothetical protein